MDWKLEVVVLPVSDVDRSKAWYVDRFGFTLDVDVQPTPTMRVVQMTPPGSACSVTIGPSILEPGAEVGGRASLQLVVTDIDAARSELTGRGIDTGDVQLLGDTDGSKFLFFQDPDGNQWAVQEIRVAPGSQLD